VCFNIIPNPFKPNISFEAKAVDPNAISDLSLFLFCTDQGKLFENATLQCKQDVKTLHYNKDQQEYFYLVIADLK
jgi:hypothetical protein